MESLGLLMEAAASMIAEGTLPNSARNFAFATGSLSNSRSNICLSRSSAAASPVSPFNSSTWRPARPCATLGECVVKIVAPKGLSGKCRSKPVLRVDGSMVSASSMSSTISSHLPALGALKCRLTRSITSPLTFAANRRFSCRTTSAASLSNASVLCARIQKTDMSGCWSATDCAKLRTSSVLPMPPGAKTANLWCSCAVMMRCSRNASSARRPQNTNFCRGTLSICSSITASITSYSDEVARIPTGHFACQPFGRQVCRRYRLEEHSRIRRRRRCCVVLPPKVPSFVRVGVVAYPSDHQARERSHQACRVRLEAYYAFVSSDTISRRPVLDHRITRGDGAIVYSCICSMRSVAHQT